MAVLFGALGIGDLDRPFTIVQGQEVMYRETQLVFQRWNEDFEAAASIFVQETTPNFKERYKLPGGGMSQEEDQDGGSESGSVKAGGSWDVAYPLKQYGDALTWTDIQLSYMTLQEYENHIQTVINRNNNAGFYLILKPLFKNTGTAFVDRIHGSLTGVPLANQDGTKYPPVFGSIVEAEENMYLAPNYIESQISATNNPFVLIRNQLEPHFGFPEGGSPIVAFVNTSATEYVRALPGFDAYTYRYTDPGLDVTTLTGLPDLPPGGRIIGHTDGVLVYEWPRIPSGWIFGVHLDAPKPLKQRRDPLDTGIAPGLVMTTRTMESPYSTARWRNRRGFGVGDRLNGVVVALNGTSSYTIPALYQ